MRNNNKETLKKILEEISQTSEWDSSSLLAILRKYPKEKKFTFAKDELVSAFHEFKDLIENREIVEERIRKKPTRTNSGVAVVTVLTKPYPCPGNCIYCPNEPNMPKSYISSEPGAQRALTNKFDPYAQVYNRLIALKNIGHNIEKVELIILGGTWSFYPEKYQLFFIHECYRAMNDIKKDTLNIVEPRENYFKKTSWKELEKEHKRNENAYCRNVGLVLETRPDYITEGEVIKMRKFGCTKVQLGIQSMSNAVLKKNNIGRKAKDVTEAFKLLRLAGFKIHGHWMANLYGSTPKKDILDYKKLWSKKLSPDELKIYPTSTIPNTKLYSLYKKGLYKPYSEDELEHVLKTILPMTPRYCRLTRIIRDIPSYEIAAGNKRTNLRQMIEDKLKEEGTVVQDIRSREIKEEKISKEDIEMERIEYMTTVGKEVFLSFKTKKDDRICGFLRLFLPNRRYIKNHFINELKGCSIIREVHVYGKVLGLKDESTGESQHLGLGKELIEEAEKISKEKGFRKISVISAIGTREYYRMRGYELIELYMRKTL
ncbi:MAG: elongator complex protein 3 [Candidatus Dojkabacteria bacterium]|jgi:elongator complex protein 3